MVVIMLDVTELLVYFLTDCIQILPSKELIHKTTGHRNIDQEARK
jgi:hypothetical protein